MSTHLEINTLEVVRDGRHIARVDHLAVEHGQVLALLGPNGAGKTSLFLTIAGLLKPARGEILLNGQVVQSTGLAYRRRIALVLQEALMLDRSVEQNVALGLNFRGVPKSEVTHRVNTWLGRLGIEHLRARPANKLSGGEAQRVSLARAFAIEPELLLLDEPFSSLDAPTRKSLLADLKNILAETNTTTIFVTHNLEEVTQFAHQFAILRDNKLSTKNGHPDLANQDILW